MKHDVQCPKRHGDVEELSTGTRLRPVDFGRSLVNCYNTKTNSFKGDVKHRSVAVCYYVVTRWWSCLYLLTEWLCSTNAHTGLSEQSSSP